MTEPVVDSDFVFKVILVGDSGVGKSSLILRYSDEVFQDTYISTIGVDLRIRTIRVDDKIAKLHIWDTAGQERFKTVCCHYYRGAEAIVFVFDITEQLSFEHLSTWYRDVKSYCKDDCVFLLIGNKSDLGEMRAVSAEQAQSYAASLNMQYMETSAKQSTNVTQLFTSVTGDLVHKHGHKSLRDSVSQGVIDSTSLNGSKPLKNRRLVTSLNCVDCCIL